MRFLVTRATSARLGLLFAAWTIYGVLSAWQSHYWYSFTRRPMTWSDCLRFEMGYGYIWFLFTPGILGLSSRFRIERPRIIRSVLVHLLAMTAIVCLTKTLFDALLMPPESSFDRFTWLKLFRSVEVTADTGVLFYGVAILVEHSLIYYGRYRKGVLNASRLQTQLAKAQLQALKMQLHPHFLFNTLHTISELVHEDPDLAERTIARLSELLRMFLANSMIHEVALAEELRILHLYLDIERTRFEDRLSVQEAVPDELLNAMAPNLLLQPLVENAIRHGLSPRTTPGFISISADRVGNTLVIRVTDNGVGLDSGVKKDRRGMGLTITRNRLESLYGPDQSLVLRNVRSGGAEVTIAIPFRTYAAPAEDQGENAELQSVDC